MAKRSLGFWAGVAVGAVLAGAAGALLMSGTTPTTGPSVPHRADGAPSPVPQALGSSSSGAGTSGSSPDGALPSSGSPSARGSSAAAPGSGQASTDADRAAGAPGSDLDAETRAQLEAALFQHHERDAYLGKDPSGAEQAPTDPAERGQWVEDTVMILIEAVAPELDGAEVQRNCSADGSVCTIEGPWPGDDFAQRWIEAISDDVIRSDDLSGVTFTAFESVESDAGTGFRITARAPAD